MHKIMRNNKGIALVIVLFTLMIVIVLANVMLALTSSQSRLTHHQVSRIQANYAAMAGMNYALEALRVGAPGWPIPGATYAHMICRDIDPDTRCNIRDNNFPASIRSIIITVSQPTAGDPPGVNAHIDVTANYTYTPPS